MGSAEPINFLRKAHKPIIWGKYMLKSIILSSSKTFEPINQNSYIMANLINIALTLQDCSGDYWSSLSSVIVPRFVIELCKRDLISVVFLCPNHIKNQIQALHFSQAQAEYVRDLDLIMGHMLL